MFLQSDSDVTVVISTFNRCRFLPEAIQSILSQTVRPRRVVIVDDGSTDDTKLVVDGFVGSVEYVYLNNGGKARALNSILPSIITEYVWFFDDDDAAYPNALEVLLNKMLCGNLLGFVFGSYDVVKTDGQLLGTTARAVPYKHENESCKHQRLCLFRECTVMMSGALIRTDSVRRIGGFNEALVRCQDYDLMVRLAAHAEFGYCGRSVYMWREHEGLRGTQQDFHADQNRVKVWAKFNEPIGRFLRYRIPVDLLSFQENWQDFPVLVREALINRAWVLAPKLPLYFAVHDLLEAFKIREIRSLNSAEIKRLESVFHHDFICFRNAIDLLGLFPLCLSLQGSVALIHICKGIYWIGLGSTSFLTRARFFLVCGLLVCAARLSKILLSFTLLVR